MAVPGGTASFGDINATMGRGYSWQVDMGFFRSNTKDGVHDMNSYRNREWYQNNTAGANCYNGHCNCWGNCGNIQCYQCWASQCVNCGNCDGRPWLQYNCNCACQYQCIPNLASYNCNCNCACDCGGSCFLAGTQITMADGTTKNIEDVEIGDWVRGAHGESNQVIALDRPLLGKRPLAIINNEHTTTLTHPVLKTDGTWGVLDLKGYWSVENGVSQPIIIDQDGTIENWVLPGLQEHDRDLMTELLINDEVKTVNGPKIVKDLKIIRKPEDTILYNLVTSGSHTYYASGYAVTGFINGIDFDYRTWKQKRNSFTREDFLALLPASVN